MATEDASPLLLSFHHLSTLDGLSQGTNSFIYHDSRGFVWMSSLDGLNRFDGRSIKTYKAGAGEGLVGNIVTSSFFEDENGDLWFTTYEALHRYNRSTDHFDYFILENEAGDSLRQDYHAFAFEDDKLYLRVGLGRAGRLRVFDTKEKQSTIAGPLDGHRNYPVRDTSGKITRIVSANFYAKGGISMLELNQPDTLKWALSDEVRKVFEIAIKDDRNWWLGADRGLVHYDPVRDTSVIYNEWNGEAIGTVYALIHLPGGRILVSTSRQELLVFDIATSRFFQRIRPEPSSESGLPVENVNAFYLDQRDNLWISSTRQGVAYANLHKRKFDDRPELRGEATISIYEDGQGRVWTNGPTGYIYRFTGKDAVSQRVPLLDQSGRRVSGKAEFFFEDAKGRLWATLLKGLFRWDEETEAFRFVTDAPNLLLATHTLSDGRILLATYSGIFLMTETEKGIEFGPARALGDYQKELVTAFFEDNNKRLYLAIDAARLAILEQRDSTYEELRVVPGTGYAKSFLPRGDSLWVAGSNGVFLLRWSEPTIRWLEADRDGVPRDHFHSVSTDANGDFWLSGNQGLLRYSPTDQRSRRFYMADGLLTTEFNTNAYALDKYGRLWLGSNEGLTVFSPTELKDVENSPIVQFADLRINDEKYEGETQVGELEELGLEYWENTFSLRLLALEYSDPQRNTFRYRLRNYEDKWVESGTNNFIRYPNLDAGRYVLEVMAANADGNWTEIPRALSIRVARPWWETWWFYLFCVTAIGLIIYAVFFYRLRQALKIERMRVKISSDLHDDVGSILTGLAMQSEVLELTAREENKPKLSRISEMSRSALSRMRDTVWAIDARKDRTKNLLDRIREHAEETLGAKGISFMLSHDSVDLERKMPSHVRQNLYLIVKEAITNTAKYSTGDHFKLTFMPFGKGLMMALEDNGKVAEKQIKRSGLGLSNMRMRAEQIGGSFELNVEDGFRITVRIPKW